MLEEVLRWINNRFERSYVDGGFEVSGGTMEIPAALEGQYFWVEGSVLNDGLHLYPDEDMQDEEFDGRVWLLAVPPAVASLADEIAAWNEANANVIDSPFASESFGGYSYQKESGSGSQDGESAAEPWKLKFGAKLRPYRKLYRDWV